MGASDPVEGDQVIRFIKSLCVGKVFFILNPWREIGGVGMSGRGSGVVIKLDMSIETGLLKGWAELFTTPVCELVVKSIMLTMFEFELTT